MSTCVVHTFYITTIGFMFMIIVDIMLAIKGLRTIYTKKKLRWLSLLKISKNTDG